MSKTPSLDVLLRSLCLSTIKREYANVATKAEKENWSYSRYLLALCQIEAQDRGQRRIERNLRKSGLPDGKTLATFDQKLIPFQVRKQIPTLLEGDFVERAENILCFGLPGRGKSHLLCAIARELIIQKGYEVLFTTTFSLVQKLLKAKQELAIEVLLKKLDRFHVILMDDIGYVQQTREEMEILFTFLAERYERKSLMITSNLVFSEWDKIFKDPMTTAAAIDRLVHHSIILELDGDSYRTRQAQKRKQSQPKAGDS
jgi:DNA replication protein DnaC